MFQFFRSSIKTKVLPDADAFWRYADATQRFQDTPPGPASDAEERLDLRAATAIKTLLESEIGPEEGEDKVQMQSWDWHDDRSRGVSILTSAFKPEVLPKLQALLVGEFSEFHIIILLFEDWKTDSWGHIKLSANSVVVQKSVVEKYAIAA